MLRNVLPQEKYESGISKVKKNQPKLYGKANRLLYNLDLGVLFHYLELYDSSNYYLENALKEYTRLYTRSVSNEAASLLTNDNVRPYRSSPYEIMMAHTFKIINYIKKEDIEGALVEVRRGRINLKKWDSSEDIHRYRASALYHLLEAVIYLENDESDNAAIALINGLKVYQNTRERTPLFYKKLTAAVLKDEKRDVDISKLQLTNYIDESYRELISGNKKITLVIGYIGESPHLGEKIWSGTYLQNGILRLYHTDSRTNGNREDIILPSLRKEYLEQEEQYNGKKKKKKTKKGMTFHVKFSLPVLDKKRSSINKVMIKYKGISYPLESMQNGDIAHAQILKDNRDTFVYVIISTIYPLPRKVFPV